MDFTGTFDGLGMDFTTGKQKATLTLNEDAKQTFENLHDKKVVITIKAYRKKRSLDANAYFHVLVGKIADVTGNSKVYIKNKLIAEYGQYETINGALVPLDKKAEHELIGQIITEHLQGVTDKNGICLLYGGF